MAALSDDDLKAVWAEFMTHPEVGLFGELDKHDIYAAVVDVAGHLAKGGDPAAAVVPDQAAALTKGQAALLTALIDARVNPPPPPAPVPDPRIEGVAAVLLDMGVSKDQAASVADRLLKALGV